MASYQFSQDAIEDINEICDYLAQNNPQSASNLFDAIRQKCKLIANFPNMGKVYSQVRPNLRGFLVGDRTFYLATRFDPKLLLSLSSYTLTTDFFRF